VEYIKALKELLGQEDDYTHSGPVLIGKPLRINVG
jgi:hypothetical protein